MDVCRPGDSHSGDFCCEGGVRGFDLRSCRDFHSGIFKMLLEVLGAPPIGVPLVAYYLYSRAHDKPFD